ncbi:MAG: redoxin domain-containing protein [Bacteroidota bacterium]
MNPRLNLLVCALLFVSLALARSEDQIVTIRPEKPAVGIEITIRYNPTVKGATLFGAEALDVQLLMFRRKDMPLLIEVPMKKRGKIWEAKMKLDDTKSVFGMIRFLSEKLVDNNEDQYWDFLVYDNSGKPMESAYLARSYSYQYPSSPDFKRGKDLSRAREEALKEESLYPNRPQTKLGILGIELADTGLDPTLIRKIARQLDTMAEQHAEDQELLSSVVFFYKRLGLAEKGQALQDRLIEEKPKGKLAQQVRFQRIFKVRNAGQRAERAVEFLKEFPEVGSDQKSTVARILIQAKQFDKAEEIILSLQPPNGNLLNSIAWEYIEKETNLERGVELAKQGVQALRNINPSSKPPHISKKQWEQSSRRTLGFTLDTYAYGLFKLERYKDAQKAYREAYDLTGGMNADINERLVQSYLLNGEYDAAIEVTKECVEKSKYNDKLLEYGKEALARKEGSAEGFDLLLHAAEKRAMAKAKEELRGKRFTKAAPDFEAENLSGEVIQLAKLKGKVVVLDFWATWCGPCRAAFPFVQKVYEKYRENSDVMILAVNTWERVKGAERVDVVENFMEKNNYTFPVVYDESKVVDKYEVEGIPTQFYIDREGTIQFKEVGFHGPELEYSMAMMIDMLLSGEILSVK